VSLRAICWALAQPVRPAARKLVLVALADEVREPDDAIDPRSDGTTCWPGQELLAEKCGLGERTVRHHLAELEAGGYLTRSRQHRRDGTRTSDLYRLLLPAISAGGSKGSTDGSPLTAPRQPAAGRNGRKSPVGGAEPAGRPDPIGDFMRARGLW
jgi:hypothetical protein